MRKLIGNLSLQAKITLAFMIMVFLTLAVLGSVFYANTADAIKAAKQSEMQTIAEETADKVERFIFERSADIKVLSDSKILNMNDMAEDIRLDYLKNVISAYKTYEGIFITDTMGNILLSSGKLPETSNILDGISGEIPFVSDVLINTDGEAIMIFSRPLYSGTGERTGSIATVMSLNSINAIIDNVKIGKTGYATLSTDNQEGTPDGQIYVSTPVDTAASSGLAWRIGVFQSEEEAYKVINDFSSYLLLVSGVSFVLFLFLSIILSRIITEPIRQLMDKMNQMARASGISGIEDDNRNEIKSLNSGFNRLLEQLNFMMQMVLEKTGEAADMNEISEKIKEIFENIPNGILTIDSAGQISSINKTAAEILKIHDIEDGELSVFKPKKQEHEDFFKILAHSLQNGRKYSGEVCYISSGEGEAVPIIFNTLRQTDQNGVLIGMTVIINLLTEKKRRDEIMLRAKRLSELGQMAAGMAHEIRNPLASIKGYAQYARLEFDESQQTYKDLSVILNEVERLDWIVERFMNFAQPNKPHKSMIQATELINGTILLMKNDFNKAGVRIKHIGNQKDQICVDASQIKQVLINVLLNSIQASSPGDEIQVFSESNEANNSYKIEISDQGAGIQEELIEKVFTPFYTTKEKGSGLGLSISTRIIENHGGSIEIQNMPGGGAKVLILLPLKGDCVNED